MVELSAALASFLAPFLPYLLKAGGAAAEEAGRHGWQTARALWSRLGPRLRAEDRRDLASALERLLAADPALAREVLALAEREPMISVTGTGNVVKHGRYNLDIGTVTDAHFGDRYS